MIKYIGAELTDAFDVQDLFGQVFSDSDSQPANSLIGELALDLITTTAHDDIYAFAAVDGEKIIGCVVFTRLRFEFEINAFILSPLAVSPKYQGRGIGQALVFHGLNVLRSEGVELVFTYGDINFYSKIGFEQISEDLIPAPFPLSYPDGWLAQDLKGHDIPMVGGDISCVDALNHSEYW